MSLSSSPSLLLNKSVLDGLFGMVPQIVLLIGKYFYYYSTTLKKLVLMCILRHLNLWGEIYICV